MSLPASSAGELIDDGKGNANRAEKNVKVEQRSGARIEDVFRKAQPIFNQSQPDNATIRPRATHAFNASSHSPRASARGPAVG